LREQLTLCLTKGGSVRAKCFVATSGLKRRVFADPSRQAWLEKFSSLLGAVCFIDHPEEPKSVVFETFLTTLMEPKAKDFNGLSAAMSRGSSPIIFLIRSGRRRMMDFLNASSRELTRKSAWFRSFDQVTEFTIFLMCPKGQHATQFSSLMLLCPA
jgi:hypothetical protein